MLNFICQFAILRFCKTVYFYSFKMCFKQIFMLYSLNCNPLEDNFFNEFGFRNQEFRRLQDSSVNPRLTLNVTVIDLECVLNDFQSLHTYRYNRDFGLLEGSFLTNYLSGAIPRTSQITEYLSEFEH